MQYVVSLDEFNGPLDLLLHLIKKDNIDIANISILRICQQYLEYINKFRDNLDITSEYLVMAAELIQMKSKMLLPNKDEEIEQEIEEERNELIDRIKLFEKYKNITDSFKDLESLRKEYFTKDSSYESISIDYKPILSDDISLDDLTNAFTKYLARIEKEKPVVTKVTTKEYSLEKRSIDIKNILKIKKNVSFDELFDNYDKGYVVITFLSILTMAKNNELKINQEDNFKKIYISEE